MNAAKPREQAPGASTTQAASPSRGVPGLRVPGTGRRRPRPSGAWCRRRLPRCGSAAGPRRRRGGPSPCTWWRSRRCCRQRTTSWNSGCSRSLVAIRTVVTWMPGCGGAQLGRCDESADEDHSVDGCSPRSASVSVVSVVDLVLRVLVLLAIGCTSCWLDRCSGDDPGQVPSGIPLAAGDMPWGLQRIGNGLVAVCDEIHDKREGRQVSETDRQHDHDRRTGPGSAVDRSTMSRVPAASAAELTSHRGQGRHGVPAERTLDGRARAHPRCRTSHREVMGADGAGPTPRGNGGVQRGGPQ